MQAAAGAHSNAVRDAREGTRQANRQVRLSLPCMSQPHDCGCFMTRRRGEHRTLHGRFRQRGLHLLRSATLRKLRPPALSPSLSFAASFSFFLDSSKSSCKGPQDSESASMQTVTENDRVAVSQHLCSESGLFNCPASISVGLKQLRILE